MKLGWLALGAALACGSPTRDRRPALQTIVIERARSSLDTLHVHVRHHVGALTVTPAPESVLYRAALRYDERSSEPVHRYNADSGSLRIGARKQDNGSESKRHAKLDLALGTGGPIALEVEAGAADSDLDFSGLPLTRLEISAGASDTRVRFERPNPLRMTRLALRTGAASLHADRLGNANAERITVQAGVGEITLDLSGVWTADAALRAEVALGSLKLRVPREVGVLVEVSRVLARFSHEGFVARDGAYVSENWESAPRKLRIEAQTLFGFITIERAEAR
ncbi:MAG: hypothetical protein ACT4R6_06385 [Gemmatimonadaceae bacterium]